MILSEMERSFNRAVFSSFSRKKVFFVFPILILCGILVVFCRAIAYETIGWIGMSMIFLPIFLSSGILLALGVLLIRIYFHEVKKIKMNYKRIMHSSWDVLIGTSYLSLPVIVAYLLLWIVLGIFILLKEIPFIGPFIGVVLSFAPFIIILMSILLVIFNLGLLFFVTPAVGLKKNKNRVKIKDIINLIKDRLFSHLFYFIVAIFPLVFIVGILCLAALITGFSYSSSDTILSVIVEWFFIMIPFCICLTPAVIFFFNFAAESYNNLYKSNEK
jgi:hypothetical protein